MIMRLVVVLCVAGAGLAAPAGAQKPEPGWIADQSTGCRVWNAAPEPPERVTWSGKCENGQAEGQGELQWFADGKLTGRYVGIYKQGKREGRGIYTWEGGDRYEGEFRDGKMDGFGVYTFANGNRYEGAFRDGTYNGRGTMTWKDGTRYDGDWRDDRPNGRGTKRDPNGMTYTGAWSNGCFQQGSRRAWIGSSAKDCGF